MKTAQERLQVEFSVSRETLEKLDAYVALIARWTKKINLIGPGTLSSAWDRHILDSAQTVLLTGDSNVSLADFGSGAGFPGMVLAILRQGQGFVDEVHLIESDQRKATFLRTVAREIELSLTVHAKRIELLDPLNADVVVARALAPLSDLLKFAHRHSHDKTKAIFLKGQGVNEEIRSALVNWSFTYHLHQSITNSNAWIIELGDISTF